MIKGFVRYYLAMVVVVTVTLLGLDFGYYQLTKGQLVEREDVKQTIDLVEQYCGVKDCTNSLPFTSVTLLKPSQIALPPEVSDALINGELIDVQGDAGQYYVYYIPTYLPDMIMQIGPLTESKRPLVDYYALGFYLLIATLLFVAFYPLFRDIYALKEAAAKFGQHKDITQLNVPKSRYFQPLGDAFLWMTNKIAKLLSLQKELSDTLSHELRTNVSRMRFTVSAMEKDNIEESQQSLEQDLAELERQINEYLNFSKQENERPELEIEPVDLATIVKNNINLLAQYTDKKVHFSALCEERIYADKRFIARAVKNLIDNAIKYSNDQVMITLSLNNKDHILVIEDDGAGISTDEKERLFLPFKRSDRATSSSGFGLGLAITQKIIHWHNGELTVEQSSTLKGAKFILVLPSKPESASWFYLAILGELSRHSRCLTEILVISSLS